MATLYPNHTVTIQDSQSPYNPINNLELYLYEGKVELKINPSTANKDVYTYGTFTLATPVYDRYGAQSVATAPDSVNRPGEYDFLEMDLNTPGSDSAGGDVLYSVVGREAGATDFTNGRIIIDNTALNDPNVKQTLVNLGGGSNSVRGNIYFAGGTVEYEQFSTGVTNSSAVQHLKILNLPQNILDLEEEISEAPPYGVGVSPVTVLIPRFNVYYSNGTTVSAVWHGIRAYQMTDDSWVIRLRMDQYNVSRTATLGSGVGQIDLSGLLELFVCSINVNENDVNIRRIETPPDSTVSGIPTSGSEASPVSVHQSSGTDLIGFGQWDYTDKANTPKFGVDAIHTAGMRVSTPTYDNLLVAHPNGNAGIRIAVPQARFHVNITENAASAPGALIAGRNCVSSGAYGVATGESSEATSTHTVAMGHIAKATGASAVALGDEPTASGQYSVAMGRLSVSSHLSTIAIGQSASASNPFAIAIGYTAESSGTGSWALGYNAKVSGNYSGMISLSSTAYTISTANFLGVMGGRVGIGTTQTVQSTQGVLDLTLANTTTYPGLGIFNANTSITNGLILGAIHFGGFDADVSAGNHIGAGLRAYSASSWTSNTAAPTYMTFYTRDTGDSFMSERMRVTASGQVGIGTITVATTDKLYVYGSARIGAGSGVGALGIGTTSPTKGIKVDAGSTSASLIWLTTTATTTLDFRIQNGTASTYVGQTTGGRAYIGGYSGLNPNNLNILGGLVGIGTVTPTSKLDVLGGVAIGAYAGVNVAPTNGMIVSGRVGIGTTNTTPATLTLTGTFQSTGQIYSTNAAVDSIKTGGGITCAGDINCNGTSILGNGSNTTELGGASNRFKRIYMTATIDYSSTLYFFNSGAGAIRMTLSTGGDLGVGTVPSGTYRLQTYTTTGNIALFQTSLSSSASIGLKNSDGTMFINTDDTKMSLGASSAVINTNFNIMNNGSIGIGTASTSGWANIYARSGASFRDCLAINGTLDGGSAAAEHRGITINTTLGLTTNTTGVYRGLSIQQFIGSGFDAPSYTGVFTLAAPEDSGSASTITGSSYGLLIQAPATPPTVNGYAYGIYVSSLGSMGTLGRFSAYFTDSAHINGQLYMPNMAGIGGAVVTMHYNINTGQLMQLLSSRRFKKNIEDLQIDASKLHSLRVTQFQRKVDDSSDIGLIAEEAAKIIPELGVWDKDGQMHSVQLPTLQFLMLKEMQNMKKENIELKRAVDALTN